MIDRDFPEYSGRFMDSANLIYDSPTHAHNKSAEHHGLVREIQDRKTRLGELLDKLI